MDEVKGNTQFTHETPRGIIYSRAFGDERPSVITEWTNEELTEKFDKYFPNIGFDPGTYNFDTKGVTNTIDFNLGAARVQQKPKEMLLII